MWILFLVIILLICPVNAGAAEKSVKSNVVASAEELIDQKRPSEAVKILSGYQPAAEEISVYHHVYAKALLQSKRLFESIDHFRLAYVYAKSEETKAAILLERAEVYSKMGYYPEAALNYKVFLKNFPSNHSEKAYLGLANALYSLGQFSEAARYYDKAGDSLAALYSKANALQSMGKTDEAYNLYRSLLEKDREYAKSSAETAYNIGENLRLMGKQDDAKNYLNSVKDPLIKPKVEISNGLIALEEKKFDRAVKHFKSALQSPDKQLKRQALLHLAETNIKIGKKDEAKANLSEVRNKYPYNKENDKAVLMLSRLYRSEDRLDEAVSVLKELVFRRTPDRNALDELESIIISAAEKDADRLLKVWKSAGQWLLEPSRSNTILKVAKAFLPTGEPFIKVGKWLLKNGSDAEKSECRMMLANFYAELGDTATASGYLNEIKEKGMEDDIKRLRAKMHYMAGEYRKAFEIFMSAADIKREDIELLADTLRAIKDNSKAVFFYEKALTKAGGSPMAYIKLADLFYDSERKADALKYYRIAVSVLKDKKDHSKDEAEWAHYRVFLLSDGKESVDEITSISKGSAGRYQIHSFKRGIHCSVSEGRTGGHKYSKG
ncbi:MAG: tetratricopeptide repeat protein [Thermodesulfovibrionales bacterium]|nr:tetratricopeptide repeat protein [Thermodesulfovibrionales bacterium]